MRIGLTVNYASGFSEMAAEVVDLEQAGLDIVFVAEAYSYDAPRPSRKRPSETKSRPAAVIAVSDGVRV